MAKSAIRIEHVVKQYGNHTVLKDISLEIQEGEFVCLLGPSGCGKSTLLRLIAGLDMPTEGKIYLKEKEATWLPSSKRNFGIVFQSYALFPNLTAFENVAYGLRNKKVRERDVNETADRFLHMVGLSDAKGRYPSQLSGGEQQRVALARALAISPSFLLLDEPLSALDAKVRIRLRKEICQIQRELHLTTIMVTHDQDEALTMADRIIVMNKAEIMQTGTPQEIYEQPGNKFVADFIGAINFYRDFEREDQLNAIRPENIQVETKDFAGSILAVIDDLEFRGNFCRLTAKVSHVLRKDELMVDLPYSEVKKKNLHVGTKIYLAIPGQQTLHFAV
ncbi:Sulfate/thiosulfate import ATP-binding protein CysA [uncultured Roseburia sp.]|uniref:ATP-binding cassette domain-containing protein n=1 Tax=Brotonthovivens ammoniilytica TaxID=2981725 RepID=A0ABT2TIB8_9FIRM|nr:ATP-binding cassette domain-containing protein [Brotonthovivens ammoniilytica]MCU6761416.1 ATP-binding cassette domain-containing protein [Brotonthovivens ammoniilytica]SCI27810.1 Sulfate/thiosulfate import ATP-binding protein CysA [uncultured Roseburia sp.]